MLTSARDAYLSIALCLSFLQCALTLVFERCPDLYSKAMLISFFHCKLSNCGLIVAQIFRNPFVTLSSLMHFNHFTSENR